MRARGVFTHCLFLCRAGFCSSARSLRSLVQDHCARAAVCLLHLPAFYLSFRFRYYRTHARVVYRTTLRFTARRCAACVCRTLSTSARRCVSSLLLPLSGHTSVTCRLSARTPHVHVFSLRFAHTRFTRTAFNFSFAVSSCICRCARSAARATHALHFCLFACCARTRILGLFSSPAVLRWVVCVARTCVLPASPSRDFAFSVGCLPFVYLSPDPARAHARTLCTPITWNTNAFFRQRAYRHSFS